MNELLGVADININRKGVVFEVPDNIGDIDFGSDRPAVPVMVFFLSLWGILWQVVLPLSKPVLITLGLFTFMGAWNMFEWPLVVLSNQDYYPLTVGLSFFRQESGADWPRIFAAGVMGAAPLIVLFLIAQRHLVGGISLSGMKT